MSKSYFKYSEKELDYLMKKDAKLAAVIKEKGFIKRETDDNIFASLINSVMSQQISGKAADAIWRRFEAMVGEITPNNVNKFSEEEIKSVGTSLRKAGYIKGIAKSTASGEVNLESLQSLDDEEIIETLVRFKGVGRWTAEMLMIFSLERKNILSFLDLGIRRGIMNLHGHEDITKEEFEYYKELYSPYGTIASFYLWET